MSKNMEEFREYINSETMSENWYLSYLGSLYHQALHVIHFGMNRLEEPEKFKKISKEFVEIILEKDEGVYLNSTNKRGETPLMLSAKYQNIHIMDILLENGAKVDMVDHVGQTALHHTACYYLGGWKLLIEKGADVFIKNNHDKTGFDHIAGRNVYTKNKIHLLIKRRSSKKSHLPSLGTENRVKLTSLID
jgi:hypothetical protein